VRKFAFFGCREAATGVNVAFSTHWRRGLRGFLHIPAERFNSDHTAFSGLVLTRISANFRRISSTLTDFWLFTELVASV
jgi:hypothetical protein